MGYGKMHKGYGKSGIKEYFKDSVDIDFLDAIDYLFHIIDRKLRTLKPEYKYDYDADTAVSDAIMELNYRFKQHNLGYEFVNSQIITIPDEYTDYAYHYTQKKLAKQGILGQNKEK